MPAVNLSELNRTALSFVKTQALPLLICSHQYDIVTHSWSVFLVRSNEPNFHHTMPWSNEKLWRAHLFKQSYEGLYFPALQEQPSSLLSQYYSENGQLERMALLTSVAEWLYLVPEHCVSVGQFGSSAEL